MSKNTLSEKGSAFVIIIIVLSVVIVGVVGFIFWQKVTNQDAVVTTTDTAATTELTANETTVIDPGQEVKSVSGDIYEYKYPSTGWVYESQNGNDTIQTADYTPSVGMGIDAGAIMTLNISTAQTTLAQYKSEMSMYSYNTDMKDVTVSGSPAVSYISSYEGVRYHTYFIHAGKAYDIVYTYADGDDASKHIDAYELMTSTFLFTD